METIKYRGWNFEEKKMVYWETILKDYLESFFGNEYFAINPPKYVWARMQFTGLKDINGKEIYEGDIVDNKINIFKVTFETNGWDAGYDCGFCGFAIKGLYGKFNNIKDYMCSINSDDDGLEVIGNVYENPELLKEKP